MMKYILATIILLIIGTFAYFELNNNLGGKPLMAKEIDGIEMSIEYTDDNTDEDLIIHSNKSDYWNWAGSVTTYFSIYNKGKSQDVTIAFSFPRDHQPLVYEEIGEKITNGYYLYHATSTEYVATSTLTIWNELAQENFNKIDLLDTGIATALKQNTVSIASGETKFFKAIIRHFPQGREEFFIQAWGSKGAIGILDPWTYTTDFDSFLNDVVTGQDSWTTNGAGRDWVVTDTLDWSGGVGKSVVATTSGQRSARRVVDGVTSGEVYRTVYVDTEGAGGVPELSMNSNAGEIINTSIADDAGTLTWSYYDNVTLETLVAPVLEKVWYEWVVKFDCATDLFDINVRTRGGAWGATSTGNTMFVNRNCTTIDAIWNKFNNDGWTIHIDNIGPSSATDPATPAAAVINDQQFWVE